MKRMSALRISANSASRELENQPLLNNSFGGLNSYSNPSLLHPQPAQLQYTRPNPTEPVRTAHPFGNGLQWHAFDADPDLVSTEARQALQEYAIHPSMLKDWMMRNHLPKIERIGSNTLVILRYAATVSVCSGGAGDISARRSRHRHHLQDQDYSLVTHKLVLYFSHGTRAVTMYRRDADFPEVADMIQQWDLVAKELTMDHFINKFFDDVIHTFRAHIINDQYLVDQYERKMTVHDHDQQTIQSLFQIRRRVSICRRLAHLINEVMNQYARMRGVGVMSLSAPHGHVYPTRASHPAGAATGGGGGIGDGVGIEDHRTGGGPISAFDLANNEPPMVVPSTPLMVTSPTSNNMVQPFIEDLRDNAKSLVFQAESVYQQISDVLHLSMALVDHKTNRLLYALTVFSVVFTPLMWMTGVYGMNFPNMPEFQYKYGYHVFMGATVLVALITIGCLKYHKFA